MTAQGLIRLRRGHAPNCSSAGSFVGVALTSAVAAAALINAFASRFLGGRPDPGDPDLRLRPEPEGGVLHDPDSGALLQVDSATAQALRARGVPTWGGRTAPDGAPSAPTEVHVAVTERCPATCAGCYLDAGPGQPGSEQQSGDEGGSPCSHDGHDHVYRRGQLEEELTR